MLTQVRMQLSLLHLPVLHHWSITNNKSLLTIFAKLPLINIVNKLGGAAYGFIKAILILYFILAVLSIITTFNSTWNFMYAIKASHIGGYLYNHNIIMNLFSH